MYAKCVVCVRLQGKCIKQTLRLARSWHVVNLTSIAGAGLSSVLVTCLIIRDVHGIEWEYYCPERVPGSLFITRVPGYFYYPVAVHSTVLLWLRI